MIDKGANVVAQDKAGETALHWACSKGSIHCVEILVEGGANLAIRDADGELASDVAKRKGYMKIFRFLKSRELNLGIPSRTKADNVQILNSFHNFLIFFLGQTKDSLVFHWIFWIDECITPFCTRQILVAWNCDFHCWLLRSTCFTFWLYVGQE